MQKCVGMCSKVGIVSILQLGEKSKKLNLVDQFMVQHAYPPKVILNGIGFMWGLHFVWESLWIPAAVVMVGFGLLGYCITRKIPIEVLVQTQLGKFFLACAQPSYIFAQLAGYSVLVFGVWVRTNFYVLLGVSLIVLTYVVAWRRAFSGLYSEEK